LFFASEFEGGVSGVDLGVVDSEVRVGVDGCLVGHHVLYKLKSDRDLPAERG
jgi:hypothetical protein